MALRRGFRENFDWPLFVTTAAIAVVGVVNLSSARAGASAPALRDMYIQQIYWLTLGAGGAVLVAAVDYRHFERYGWIAYGVGVAMLVLVFLLAREVRGSQRWSPIGSLSVPPSEVMKVCFIVGPAQYLESQ